MPPEGNRGQETFISSHEKSKDVVVNNYINGDFVSSSTGKYESVENPSSGKTIGSVAISGTKDVNDAVASASAAFPAWCGLTVKSRAAIMMKFNHLIKEHASELAELIVQENGKNYTEALADVAKGNETVEYACGIPQMSQGNILKVSRQVTCEDRRDPLGVVASIVPFNFPFMVPMWTLPIALVTGNTIVLKPSEKVPLTMNRTIELLTEAGVPKGVVNIVNGSKDAVDSLIEHEDVRAVTFVGSSPIAQIVKSKCDRLHKRCTALGGAKNHLIALPDCDLEETSRDVVVSAFGCAGQRCMAASVLLIVGEGEMQQKLLSKIIDKASQLEPGTCPGKMGPVIDKRSLEKIVGYINNSESIGSKLLVDGRPWTNQSDKLGCGYWVGPTIIQHSSCDDAPMKEEIFGPVLSIHHVSSWEEAMKIENSNPFGNAACIYTNSGGSAEWFVQRFKASMLGINVGIPVPREPFSFGGLYGSKSKYGDCDMTGDGAIEFFTNRIKITTKWQQPSALEVCSRNVNMAPSQAGIDHANFVGRM